MNNVAIFSIFALLSHAYANADRDIQLIVDNISKKVEFHFEKLKRDFPKSKRTGESAEVPDELVKNFVTDVQILENVVDNSIHAVEGDKTKLVEARDMLKKSTNTLVRKISDPKNKRFIMDILRVGINAVGAGSRAVMNGLRETTGQVASVARNVLQGVATVSDTASMILQG